MCIRDRFYAKARNYETALNRALFADDVPVSLYDKLIDIVHENLPIMYDYVALRKKLLDVYKRQTLNRISYWARSSL